jgi:hypothetical protein
MVSLLLVTAGIFNVLACPVAIPGCGAAILSATCMGLLGLPNMFTIASKAMIPPLAEV